MTVYIDSEFLCHTEDAEGRTAVEADFFDGKCRTFIEGYRLIPFGETWTREDGEVFKGQMICPATSYSNLVEAQRNYEEGQADVLTFVENALGVET